MFIWYTLVGEKKFVYREILVFLETTRSPFWGIFLSIVIKLYQKKELNLVGFLGEKVICLVLLKKEKSISY